MRAFSSVSQDWGLLDILYHMKCDINSSLFNIKEPFEKVMFQRKKVLKNILVGAYVVNILLFCLSIK